MCDNRVCWVGGVTSGIRWGHARWRSRSWSRPGGVLLFDGLRELGTAFRAGGLPTSKGVGHLAGKISAKIRKRQKGTLATLKIFLGGTVRRGRCFKSCCRLLFGLSEIKSHQYGCASLAERRHLQIPLLTILFCTLNGCACIIRQLAGRGWGARVGVPGGGEPGNF